MIFLAMMDSRRGLFGRGDVFDCLEVRLCLGAVLFLQGSGPCCSPQASFRRLSSAHLAQHHRTERSHDSSFPSKGSFAQ